jgi:carbamate kinase
MKTAVVALGGNAISGSGKEDIHRQFANTRKSLDSIIALVRADYNLAITHGNGPQVGNALLRVERTMADIPVQPLGVIVADTQGSMGYMIEQSLQNRLIREKIDRRVATIVTQVIVDRDDPSIKNPSKFIGPFYTKEQAELLADKFRWTIREDVGRGFRRVVPSPKPKAILNQEIIRRLVSDRTIVIAGGGGGIPVYVEPDGTYEGVDAVIDKDLASAVLARDIEADHLMILTSVSKVSLNFKKPDQADLDIMNVADAKKYLGQGQFPPGSMGPKIEASIAFLEWGGREVIITSLECANDALSGKAGTRIVN